jgi:hypothetical protein
MVGSISTRPGVVRIVTGMEGCRVRGRIGRGKAAFGRASGIAILIVKGMAAAFLNGPLEPPRRCDAFARGQPYPPFLARLTCPVNACTSTLVCEHTARNYGARTFAFPKELVVGSERNHC